MLLQNEQVKNNLLILAMESFILFPVFPFQVIYESSTRTKSLLAAQVLHYCISLILGILTICNLILAAPEKPCFYSCFLIWFYFTKMRLYHMLCLDVFHLTIKWNNRKWTDIHRHKTNTTNSRDPFQIPTFSSTVSCTHTLKGFWGPVERHVSSPLSAVFAVWQARGTPHLRKRRPTQANGRKEGSYAERPRPWVKRVPTKRLSSGEEEGERERDVGWGRYWNNALSAAGAMANSQSVCVGACVCTHAHRTLFFVLIELIYCLFSAPTLTHSSLTCGLLELLSVCVCTRMCVCRITKWAVWVE